METDRIGHLISALLAYQAGMIVRDQMLEALRIWIDDKERNVADILRDQQAIDSDACELLKALSAKHIAQHQGDPIRSFDALTSISDSLAASLAELDDPDVNQTATLALGHDDVTPVTEGGFSSVADSQHDQQPGRFTVVRPHARGGLGEVFLAFDHELNRHVALKEIQGRYSSDTGSRLRFLQEAEITGGLEHPGIVPVYGLGTYQDGRPFYAMRFIKGVSLADAAKRWHRERASINASDYQDVPFRQLLRRLVDVCQSIEYAHSRGVLHRDLKPGNIMLGKYGETLVVDWGLAKAVGRRAVGNEPSEEETLRPSSGSDSTRTSAGQTLGTPAYMSPEAAAGRIDEMGVPSDVYCLGTTLYYVLTGVPPFPRRGSDTLELVRTGQFDPPRERCPAVPKPLDAICRKAMALECGDRYRSAAELAEEIERWLADRPVMAYPEPLTARMGRVVRNHRAAVLGIAGIVLVALVGAAGYAAMLAQKNEQLGTAYRQAEEAKAQALQNRDTAAEVAKQLMDFSESNLPQSVNNEPQRLALMESIYTLFSDLHADNPEDAKLTRELAEVCRVYSNLCRYLNDFDRAAELLDQSIRLQELLASDEHPDLFYLAETYRDVVTLEKARGNLTDARDAEDRGLMVVAHAAQRDPSDESLQRTSGQFTVASVGLYLDLMDNEGALNAAEQGEDVFLKLAQGEQGQLYDRVLATILSGRRGMALTLVGRGDEARDVYEAAIERGKAWIEREPNIDLRNMTARLYLYFADDLSRDETLAEDAETIADEALRRFRILADTRESSRFDVYLARALRLKAVIDHRQEELESAQQHLDDALAILEPMIANPEGELQDYQLHELAEAYLAQTQLHQSAGNTEATRTFQQKAVEAQKRAAEISPESLLQRQRLIDYERALNQLPDA